MEKTTIIDDTNTSADRWKDWRITSFQQAEGGESLPELSGEGEFTKEDFEKVLKKVGRKIKK